VAESGKSQKIWCEIFQTGKAGAIPAWFEVARVNYTFRMENVGEI